MARALLVAAAVLVAGTPVSGLSPQDSMRRIKASFTLAASTGQLSPPDHAHNIIPFPKVVEIPMRDGVTLHSVYITPGPETKQYSTVIDRSPYGDTGTELVADVFLPLGFASIGQDFRGTKQSGGKFDLWRASYNDTVDTVQWIVNQKWSNKKIHICGGSADGIASLVLAAQPAIPEVVSQFIIWATAVPYSSVYPGGAYRHGLIDGWLTHYIKKTNSTELEKEVRKHESSIDPWWVYVTPDKEFSHVTAPTVFWAGWYDIFLNGNLVAFEGWQKSTGGKSWLVVDPIGHCQDAEVQFPGAGIEGRVALAALLGANLFQGTLNKPGEEVPENVKKVTFFVMGANHSHSKGNFWTTHDNFPTPNSKNMYLRHDGTIKPTPPEAADTLTFEYDPKNPAPTIGGNNLELPCGPLDQRPKESRPDVLVFTGEPQTEALAIVGQLSVTLHVSSANVNDTDWTAQISDVYPDGTSRLLQDGIVRMRWRNKGLHPEPIAPGHPETIVVDLWTTAYVFDPGHALRVSISSSNYPRFQVNPNTGLPLTVENQSPIVAKNTLYMSLFRPSHVTLPVVSLEALPKHFVV